jgi:NAD(P)-dependent dehydrogenase (short-subunit alcohol dehydrogenase family)
VSCNAPIILITGASSGIGAAIARKSINYPFRICINYRSHHERAERLKQELEASGISAFCVQADISQQADIDKLFDVVDQHGRLAGLVNNAGVITQLGTIADVTMERLQWVFGINVFGAFLCAKEAVKRMSTLHGGEGGVIINISSIASRLGSPNDFIDYAATKGAVDTLTTGLAKEVANQGIRVNAIRPGLIDTEMHQHAGDADRASKLSHAIPMGRVGTAEDVANAVWWLLSDEASYVTGAMLDVSGGR